jgi:hypothetical protein
MADPLAGSRSVNGLDFPNGEWEVLAQARARVGQRTYPHPMLRQVTLGPPDAPRSQLGLG